MKFVTVLVLSHILLTTPPVALGQQSENAIIINVRETAPSPTPTPPAASYLNGYHSSIDGQTIDYHSSDPDADSALLVRAKSAAPSITWETDSMPESSSGYVQFIWLAGIECHGFEQETDVHQFDFLINGQRWFVFKNAKDSKAEKWKVVGKDGAELFFDSLLTDKAGDLFGYMILKLAASDFAAGKPLKLEVKGDNSGSADWFMTFQHRFNFVPQVRAEPALMRDGTRNSQVLRLSLDNLNGGRTMEVDTPNHERVHADLKIGSNIVQLPIPAATSEITLPVLFKIDNKLVDTSAVHITPVKKRDIYLLSYSHNDIGYTDLQPDVERKQWNNIDQAMRLIRETRNSPKDARYKWNLETIWALDSYLKRASKEQREEFFADVREGSIGLSALYANMLTGLATAPEMSHFFDFARSLRAEQHIPMATASTSDVPGFSWGLVSALAQSGVKYFATAPNSGDRIGYVQDWGDKPFYWASQSGQEKVLTWMAGASYSSFHEGTLGQLGDEKILKMVRKLDAASYPYEIYQLPYTLADNGPTDPTLSDTVKKWNERYVTPHLIIATHEQMFREFEKRYGSTLPVVAGDFTPYWEDGAASTAFETALGRAAVDRIVQGQVLWSMLATATYPDDQYAAAWRNIAFFDEHTWGAHNSTEEPDLPFVKQQWEIKRKFVLDADRASRALLGKAFPARGEFSKDQTAISVYNTNSWSRTDVIFLSPEFSAIGDRVTDSHGNLVPSQRLSTGELAVLAENIPQFSSKRVVLSKGEAYSAPAAAGGVAVRGNTLENDFIKLSVNPRTGTVDDLKEKQNDIQLVDGTRGGLGQYLYVLGTDSDKTQRVSDVRVRIKEQGSLVSSLIVEADAPGASRYSSEIRLVAGINRLDLITNIDKRAVRELEGVHIAFPFSVPDSQLRYDVADSIVRPEKDQLTGACKNFFSVQSWVDISNEKYGVTWSTANAPMVEIGAVNAERPWMKSITPSSSIYSYVMNNYWHTNYKADQAGPVTFNYSLTPHAAFSAIDAVKFGTERRQPLIVTMAEDPTPPQLSLLTLSSPNVVVSSLRPVGDGSGWLVRLYNPTHKTAKLGIRGKNGEPMLIYSSDAAGKIGDEVHEVEVLAFGSAYLRVDQSAK